jgi:hypothetical protein
MQLLKYLFYRKAAKPLFDIRIFSSSSFMDKSFSIKNRNRHTRVDSNRNKKQNIPPHCLERIV